MIYKIFTYTLTLLLASFPAFAQQSPLAGKYRQMALDYSHDLKTAERNIAESIELVKAAQKDFAPRISAEADFKFTGNPLQLEVDVPALGGPIAFRGQQLNYGGSLSILQPVYAGGKLLETVRMARTEENIGRYREEQIRSGIYLQTDLQYWNTVAMAEMLRVSEESRNTIDDLARTIRERVEAGAADRQDLLMMEVRLNGAEYQVLSSRNDFENARMALNSLIGVDLQEETEVEDFLPALDSDIPILRAEAGGPRPEEKIASEQVNLAKSDWQVRASRYRPSLSVGADGFLSSPGYNFRPDIVPNYAVYAKLTVPICQWGKRKNEKTAAEHRIGAASDNLEKVTDAIRLEVQTARNSLVRAVSQVALAGNSLDKAVENETLAVDRYNEGKASITEVIDAQTYRLSAQVSFISAKASAMSCLCSLMKAMNLY